MSADWLMWLDADEFLLVNTGACLLPDLITAIGAADGMAINWRLFGDSGFDRSPDGLVTDAFRQAAPLKYRLNRSVKTLHRVDDRITGLFIHRPVWRDTTDRPVRLLSGAGMPLSQEFVLQPKDNGNPQEMVDKGQQSWQLAQVNHYAVKALERVAAKKLRGDGLYADWSSRFDFRYLKRFNKNDENGHSGGTLSAKGQGQDGRSPLCPGRGAGASGLRRTLSQYARRAGPGNRVPGDRPAMVMA